MLQVNNLEVTYSSILVVIRGVSLRVGDGQVVALLGSNGAGKSTLLKANSGMLGFELGKVTEGGIIYNGDKIDGLSPTTIVRKGIFQVFEGRPVCEHLTVEENLLIGSYSRSDSRREIANDLDMVYGYFPSLARIKGRTAGYISGGERQMLVVGRGLLAKPSLMLLDEPTLGLSPLIVEEFFRILERLNVEQKIAILLVEQNARAALSLASYAYVMENGRVVLDGHSDDLMKNEDIKEFYLGLGKAERRSYRDVKHYKRRKRWLG
jgi:branched-chain amino acid transport system ATP-binding protein